MLRASLTRCWAIGMTLAFVLSNGCALQPGTAGPLEDAGLADGECGDGATEGGCGFDGVDEKPRRRCLSETDAQFCARLGKDCGTLSGPDNCRRVRTVASCGACIAPDTCGGGGASNVCGARPSCGDRVAAVGEACDGADLRGATCVTKGFASGTLACLADCSAFDSSGCIPTAPPPDPILPAKLAAFPGCEGAGCYTRGGFNANAGTPRIFRVTSLASDTGAGTLGECIAASGPRVCVFAVAGTIHAPSTGYIVTNPYITIRADTAPGQGVNIDFNGVSGADGSHVLYIKTHDVVVRGIRVRHGHPFSREAYDAGGSGDSLDVYANPTSPTKSIVIDHVSANWGSDECLTIYPGPSGMPADNYPHDITVSYSLIGEGMSKGDATGSRGALMAAYGASYARYITNVDWHHNFFTNNARRHPEIHTEGDVRVVNNIMNNWGDDSASFQNGVFGDFIANMGRTGSRTRWPWLVWVGYTDANYIDTRRQSVYLHGNKFYGGAVQGWGTLLVREHTSAETGLTPEHRITPLTPAISGPAILAESVDNLPTSVAGAGGAGHSRRLDCGGAWVTNGVRDSVDTRLIGEFFNPPASYPGTKTCTDPHCWPLTVAETPSRGFPVITSIASSTICSPSSRDNTACVCADADADGIPDYWESAFCGSPTGCSALATTVAAPWTNLEAFQSGSVVAP